ncbi:hypothetical protein W129_01426 [Staphylococcus aureus DAR3581]|nr:hypothetical protein W129_01426 [Staphylococcus aureus DAR3581]
MIDTIKVNNKTIPWLYVERGFEIPSFNYVLKTENVDGRSGSIYIKGVGLNLIVLIYLWWYVMTIYLTTVLKHMMTS